MSGSQAFTGSQHPPCCVNRQLSVAKALAVYELVMQRHSLSLAELRDAVRLSSPVRHPNAKGGKPAQSQHVNRSPGLPLISISQFAVWVQQAIDDIASMSSS